MAILCTYRIKNQSSSNHISQLYTSKHTCTYICICICMYHTCMHVCTVCVGKTISTFDNTYSVKSNISSSSKILNGLTSVNSLWAKYNSYRICTTTITT